MTSGGERDAQAAGREWPPLLQRLFTTPQVFELFQAVRLVEWEAAAQARSRNAPLPARVGGMGVGGGVTSPVRFRSNAALGFPTGAITRITRDIPDSTAPSGPPHRESEQVELIHLELACFGFIGPAGTLPRHYTALVMERWRRHRDTTLRDFLDIFLQRLAPLLYRAWAKYRPAIQYEQTILGGKSAAWDEAASLVRDPVTAVVASLAGIGGTALDGRMQTADVAVLAYASHFARQPRSAGALEQMLAELVGTGVRVVQFIGRWLRLEPADVTRLAGGGASEGHHARLGVDTIVGNRVWDVESAFEVRLGPLDDAGFRSRLPGGRLLAALGDFIRLYAGPQYHVQIRLVLAAADVPGSRLGGGAVDPRGLPSGTRLGWTSWLVGPEGVSVDRDDAAFVVTA